jgi:hypothetical protein
VGVERIGADGATAFVLADAVSEYGEMPMPFSARTRYSYVVFAERPVSLYVRIFACSDARWSQEPEGRTRRSRR